MILAVAGALFVAVDFHKIQERLELERRPLPQKIQKDIELYDNWAISPIDSGNLMRENFINLNDGTLGNDLFMDRRVIPYAEKMLEVARENDSHIDVIAAYSIGLDLKSNDFEWLQDNSWRFGFISEALSGEDNNGIMRFRYVGVFPAEQMYYSGLNFEEYVESLTKPAAFP